MTVATKRRIRSIDNDNTISFDERRYLLNCVIFDYLNVLKCVTDQICTMFFVALDKAINARRRVIILNFKPKSNNNVSMMFFFQGLLDTSYYVQLSIPYTKSLIRKFAMCSLHVKKHLYRAYCANVYGVLLWHSFRVSVLRKFIVCFNNAARIFFCYARFCSASQMFVSEQLDNFNPRP